MLTKLDATLFLQMITAGSYNLQRNVEKVNALNVFPVPDGDTGTNMHLTLASGVQEMQKAGSSGSIGKLADSLARGLLMGARGNSGVILSQLFRGFSKLVDKQQNFVNTAQFIAAVRAGVDTAYKAVIKPVEGTILTVAKSAAAAAGKYKTSSDFIDVMRVLLESAQKALDETPKQLAVLKKAGVVDAGGQGLVYIYEGMLTALLGQSYDALGPEASIQPISEVIDEPKMHEESPLVVSSHNVQAGISPDEIEFGYCTEFLIDLTTDYRPIEKFSEEHFCETAQTLGDSLLIVADTELAKVHIHTERPGEALTFAQRFGDLLGIKIENMRKQHAALCEQEPEDEPITNNIEDIQEVSEYAIIAVLAGDGLVELFKSLGANVIVGGGQSMNPSIQDLLSAIESVSANQVILLPNNKNIILTAQEAVKLVDKTVTVIPTVNIAQGLAALVGFDVMNNVDENKASMLKLLEQSRSGEVTVAVRDAQIDEHTIRAGDYLGLLDGEIVQVNPDLFQAAKDLLDKLLSDDADVITIIYGEDVKRERAEELLKYVETNYPDIETDIQYGGQPLYYFLFAVE